MMNIDTFTTIQTQGFWCLRRVQHFTIKTKFQFFQLGSFFFSILVHQHNHFVIATDVDVHCSLPVCILNLQLNGVRIIDLEGTFSLTAPLGLNSTFCREKRTPISILQTEIYWSQGLIMGSQHFLGVKLTAHFSGNVSLLPGNFWCYFYDLNASNIS